MNFMRTITLAAACILVLAMGTPAHAQNFEYPFVYKSARTMAMGGAGVAMGGRFDNVFGNPASLGRMPVDNWEVSVLGLTMTAGENSLDFVGDIQDAFDVGDLNGDGDTSDDETSAVNGVLQKYLGKNLNFGLADLTSIARGGEEVSFGLGLLGSVNLNMSPHQGVGSAGLLEVHGAVDVGGLVGMSMKVNEDITLGASAKFINRNAVDHTFTALELVQHEDDMEDYLTDTILVDGSGLGIDLGMIYDLDKEGFLRPSVGASVLNVGDLDFGDAGKIPMTVNVGFAIAPDIGFANGVSFGIDLVDITKAYDQDDDMGKRIRLGGEVALFDTVGTSLFLRAGMYQGYVTYGAEVRLAVLSVSYTSYAEEIGAYSGQEEDRRHMVNLTLGW
jgi:hypothetical protein